MARMTEDEYTKAQAFLLKDIPEEFQGAFSHMAWERGHSGGYDECLNILRELVDDLGDTIKKYGKRVSQEAYDEAKSRGPENY